MEIGAKGIEHRFSPDCYQKALYGTWKMAFRPVVEG